MTHITFIKCLLRIRSGRQDYPTGRQIDWSCDELTWEQHVHELAVGGPATHLLYLAQLGVETVVDPGQHLVPSEGGVRNRWERKVNKTIGKQINLM